MDDETTSRLVTITGAGGNAGQAVARAVAAQGYRIRMADVSPPAPEVLALGDFVRCDTRTVADVQRAVEGADAVIHLAAWHNAHEPSVSDASIFAVNVDGTFNVLEACRESGVQSIVYASSMAYGWGSVYSLTKVIGEEMCRAYQTITGASIAMLRYHAFVPSTYLEFGARLLRNGVDREDVAAATVAALDAVVERRVDLFQTIVHTDHGMPAEVQAEFARLGPDWLEGELSGTGDLIARYGIDLPETVEQHDLSSAREVLGWAPSVNFLDFLRDLRMRDERGDDIRALTTPGTLPR